MLLHDLFTEAILKPGERKEINLKLVNFKSVQPIIDSYETTLYKLNSLKISDDLVSYIDKLKKDVSEEITKQRTSLSERTIQFGNFMKGVTKNCKESVGTFISTDTLIYRGMNNSSDAVYGRPFDERKSKDSLKKYSDIYNQMLKKAGVTARRDNSIFATARLRQAKSYGGTTYIIFPKDGFHCAYSKNTSDLVLDSTNANQMFDKEILKKLHKDLILGDLEYNEMTQNIIDMLPRLEAVDTLEDIALAKKYNNYIKSLLDQYPDEKVFDILTKLRKQNFREEWMKMAYIRNPENIGTTGFFGESRWLEQQQDIISLAENRAIDSSYKERVQVENLITPESVVTNYQIVEDDLAGAINSNNEIMITGFFYGINQEYEAAVREYLGMKKI